MPGLRELAAQDARQFLNDQDSGFAWSAVVIAPDGTESDPPLRGFSTDIAQMVDPETGVAISGRSASVTLNLQDVLDAFGTLPRRVADRLETPWRVRIADIVGQSHEFVVTASDPDRALGYLVLSLGAWDGGDQ